MTLSRQEQMEQARAERAERFRAQRRAERRRELKQKAALVGAGAFVVAALFMLAALVFQVVLWNLGVVGLAAALGASVGEISFLTALGGLLVVSTLRSIISGTEYKVPTVKVP